jgi:hypothetical protein
MTLTLKGRVKAGRLVIDDPVELAVVDAGDNLDEAERERLHAALLEAQGEIDRGEGIPAEQVIERLRWRRQ